MGQVVERKVNTNEILKKDTATGYDGITVCSTQTNFYDTRDYRIAERKGALSKRLENDICVYSLEVPEECDSKYEFSASCESLTEAISTFSEMGAPAWVKDLSEDMLICVCRAQSVRSERLI